MEEAYDSLCYSVRSDDLLLCQTFIPNSEIETVVGWHKPTFQLHRSILEILVEQVRSKYRNEFEIPFVFLSALYGWVKITVPRVNSDILISENWFFFFGCGMQNCIFFDSLTGNYELRCYENSQHNKFLTVDGEQSVWGKVILQATLFHVWDGLNWQLTCLGVWHHSVYFR